MQGKANPQPLRPKGRELLERRPSQKSLILAVPQRPTCDRRSASALETRAEAGDAGDAGKTEDSAKANSLRDGIWKTSGTSRRIRARRSDRALVRASPCRPAATINAPRQQAGHTKALDPTLGAGQGKNRVAGGARTLQLYTWKD